jgi:hypothetical protein
MTEPHVVGLVVDPQFGGRLEGLAARMHVWVVESTENRKVAEQLWATGLRGMEVGGVTTFGKGSIAGAEKLCLDVIESIDLHHYYHDPPYSVLEVVGARLSPSLQEELGKFGFTKFTETPEGFRASK